MLIFPIAFESFLSRDTASGQQPDSKCRICSKLINTDSTQDCLLGTNAQEDVGFTLILPDGQEIPRSPAPTVERYSKESEPKDSTTRTGYALK